MAILSLGISHRRATVDLLERLSFGDDDLVKGYRSAIDEPAIEGAVILSTCNRVEIYAEVPAYHTGFLALKRLLAESRSVDPEEFGEALYSHYEGSASEHLFDVAAGLDSMVLGEPQILSQVREAHRRAQAEGATTSPLTALFHAAARAGRRVRTDTGVGAAPDAFVSAGADLASAHLGDLAGSHAIVVGAGQMSALAVKHLRDRGVGTITVLNRSPERARALAERTGARSGGLDALSEAIADADLLVSATGASGIVVGGGVVAAAMTARPERPLFLLDLAVPRDVDSAVGEIDGVRLIDIEGLRESLASHEHEIAEEIRRAHAIVRDEVHRFAVRRRADDLAPLIAALRRRGDETARAEIDRYRSELAALTPDEREAVASIARGIVAKLLHDPIVRLKERSAPGADTAYARTLADLFDLDLPEPPAP